MIVCGLLTELYRMSSWT